MSDSLRYWLFLVAFLFVGFLLGFPYLNNKLFFDDFNFFQQDTLNQFSQHFFLFYPRWWVYKTLSITYDALGREVLWLRLGNLLLHLAVVAAFAEFLRALLCDVDERQNLISNVDAAVLVVAGLFVVHPLAFFTQGYLIQRTILCAMLFSLLGLIAFWRGLSGSRVALWGSCVFYALAVYAKEHAVMLPFVAFLLLVLRIRSGLLVYLPFRSVVYALLVQCVVALLVVLQVGGVIGVPYEILTQELLRGEVEIPHERLYPLSVLNQAALFFKYMGLWLFPLPGEVSVDVRQAFPLSFSEWRIWMGVVAFLACMGGAMLLLLRGGAKGLLGLSLLIPGVLFLTEFSSVRLQEPFVIYRSYLWMPFVFIGVALGVRYLRGRVIVVLMSLFLVLFVLLSNERLKTFSSPLLVWREAADLYEANSVSPGVFGGYRIYYNLGNELKAFGLLQSALSAQDRALELKPDYAWAVNNRGAIFLDMKKYSAAQSEYERAVRLMPDNTVSWSGLAQALEMQGFHERAEKARQLACVFSGRSGCIQAGFGDFSTEN